MVRDPAVEQHVATLRKQVEQREKNRGRADEFWKEGLSLLSERKTAEAAISMRMKSRRASSTSPPICMGTGRSTWISTASQ